MKTLMPLLIFLSGAGAYAADVQVSPCGKNAKVLYVEINGESAVSIFRALAGRIGLKPSEMMNTVSNGMNCEGSKFTENGDVSEARCSYLMVGQKNVPYPQVDAGYSREDAVECN